MGNETVQYNQNHFLEQSRRDKSSVAPIRPKAAMGEDYGDSDE